jgi:Uma2 family endonuclease
MRSLHRALDARLRGTACQALGPDAGLATIGDAVRYPDALVTCTPVPGAELTVPGVVCVFEIVSPTSVRTDHTVKVAEYAAVPSILRYVIIESAAPGLLVLHRASSDLPWTADALAPDDILLLPEIAAGIPVAELYSDAEFPAGL